MCINTFLGGLGDIDRSNRLYLYLYLYIYMLLHTLFSCTCLHDPLMVLKWIMYMACQGAIREERADWPAEWRWTEARACCPLATLGRSCISQGLNAALGPRSAMSSFCWHQRGAAGCTRTAFMRKAWLVRHLLRLVPGKRRMAWLRKGCTAQFHCLPCLPSVLGFEDHLVIVLDWDARELPHSPAVIQGPICVAARDCRLTRSGHLLSLSVRTPVPHRKVACIADLLFNKTTDRLMVQDAINLQGSLRISPAGQPEDSRPDSG